MTQFEALKGLYTGTHALVLGGDTIVYLAGSVDKMFVVEQHGKVVDRGRLSPAQAKHFTTAATGACAVTRTPLEPGRAAGSADA